MFREKYKKDNQMILVSEELKDTTKERMKHRKKNATRYGFKVAVSLVSVTVVLCVCAIGSLFMPRDVGSDDNVKPALQATNLFNLTAYAMEQMPDGTFASRELKFSQKESTDKEHFLISRIIEEGEDIYYTVSVPLAFKCEGQNIENITFNVDCGEFTRWGGGSDTTSLGKVYTLNYDDLSNQENMIMWTFNLNEDDDTPLFETTVNITASATFKDGQKQERELLYNVSKGELILNEE